MKNERKRLIEIFTAGCVVCDAAIQLVKNLACSSCEVAVYNLASPCDSEACLMKAKSYGIKTLPAIAVNGVLLNCCQTKGVSGEEFAHAGVGSR